MHVKGKSVSTQSEIIPRLYMKLLPIQIILVIIGGANSIIDNGFAGNLIVISAVLLFVCEFSFGLPFFCLGSQFTAFLQLEHQEKRSYAAVIAMFAANTFFNWLFIPV